MRMADCHPDQKYFCRGLCRTCYNREYQKTRPSRKEYHRDYYAENPEVFKRLYEKRQGDDLCRARDAETKKWWAIRDRYKLSREAYMSLIESQNDCCALCGKSFKILELNSKTDPRNVDHCHETGRVRGILCTGCNSGLGQLGDNIEGLMRAIAYIKNSEDKTHMLAKAQPLE